MFEVIRGLPWPHNPQGCFRVLEPPALPSSLAICWLRTFWMRLTHNFTHLGLHLENFFREEVLSLPLPPLSSCIMGVRDGSLSLPPGGRAMAAEPPHTHQCSRSIQGPGALAGAQSKRKRPGESWPHASGGTRWLHSVHSPLGTGIAAGI